MNEKIKDLLRRLLEAENVRVVSLDGGGDAMAGDHDCAVREDLDALRESLAKVPGHEAPTKEIVDFGLEFLSNLAKEFSKDGQVKDLEAKLFLAKKPEGLDLDAEEHTHMRLHIDHRLLLAQKLIRDAEALSRFVTVVRSAFEPPRGKPDA